MPLGKMLLVQELVNADQLRAALARRKVAGGRLEENLVALGFLTQEKLEAFLQEPPPVPTTIRDTGLDTSFLVRAVLKIMQQEAPSLFHDYELVPLPDGTFEATTPHRKV